MKVVTRGSMRVIKPQELKKLKSIPSHHLMHGFDGEPRIIFDDIEDLALKDIEDLVLKMEEEYRFIWGYHEPKE